mmetsp:Transcript_65652/g.129379  ORF Transcript_65652/g.129379 Transcript_65652/m.129379 type:complete len:186 (-) Transcript_65652:249-806(-)
MKASVMKANVVAMASHTTNVGLIVRFSVMTCAVGFFARWASKVWRATWLALDTSHGNENKAMLPPMGVEVKDADAVDLSGDGKEQEECVLVSGVGQDEIAGVGPEEIEKTSDGKEQEECTLVSNVGPDESEETADEPVVKAHSQPIPKLQEVPFKDAAVRRARSESVGCFNMQGLFANSKKKSKK